MVNPLDKRLATKTLYADRPRMLPSLADTPGVSDRSNFDQVSRSEISAREFRALDRFS